MAACRQGWLGPCRSASTPCATVGQPLFTSPPLAHAASRCPGTTPRPPPALAAVRAWRAVAGAGRARHGAAGAADGAVPAADRGLLVAGVAALASLVVVAAAAGAGDCALGARAHDSAAGQVQRGRADRAV